jgi:hypothetical protein
LAEHIEVRLDEDTVWLNRNQLATLFGRDVKTIGKHINNVFSEGELNKASTVANFATVQNEGGSKNSSDRSRMFLEKIRFIKKVYVAYNIDGVRKFCIIDQMKSNVPSKYHNFIDKVNEKISQLK